MAIGLRPGVSFCEASGHLVFLDIEADCYFGLSGLAEAAFRRCLRLRPPDCNPDELFGAGLLVDAPDAAPLQPCSPPPMPRTSLLDSALPRPQPLRMAAALAGLLRTRLQLRVVGLASILRTIAAQQRDQREVRRPASEIPSAMAAHRACSLLVRSHDQCLVRSAALVRHLGSRGQTVNLVIGVRVRPFSAHAWVQKGDCLLNETCEAARGYTPILVL